MTLIKDRKTIFLIISLVLTSINFMLINVFNISFNNVINYVLILFLIYFCIRCIFICKNQHNIVQPIVIIDALIIVTFAVRAFYLLTTNWNELLAESTALRMYSSLYGAGNIYAFDISGALSLILMLTVLLNSGYFLTRDNKEIFKDIRKFDLKNEKVNMGGIMFVTAIMTVNIILFFSKYGFSYLMSNAGKLQVVGIDFSFYETLWLYIFPILISYLLIKAMKKEIPYFITIIMSFIYFVLLISLSRRSYIVNLGILLFMILLYCNKSGKVKFKLSYVILGILIMASVLLFASIRDANIGKSTSTSIFTEIISEFDMFDMLLCSRHYFTYHTNYYNGLNYLSFPFIPTLFWPSKPTYFDVYNCQIIFQNIYKAGIPTTIFGSLYLNFGYFSLLIVYFIGRLLKKIYNKIFPIKSINAVIIYSIFLCFVYDCFRVGDITRETWSFMLFLACYFICKFLIFSKKEENKK